MEQKPRQNLDDIILSIFEEDDHLVFPITSDEDARTFTTLLQRKGFDNNRLSQELGAPEAEVNRWQKSVMKSTLGRRVTERINQPLMDYLLFESELEYADSFIYVEELSVEGFDDSELICNGANHFFAIGGERVVGRTRCLLRAIMKRKFKRIPIREANGESEGQSKGHGAITSQWENAPSDQGASVDEGDFSLANSERELDVACDTRVDERCAQTQQEDNAFEMAEVTEHADCNALDSAQPDWDDICDRFLLADENSLYEDIQTETRAIDQGQESAGSLTDIENPQEDNETTMIEVLNTLHVVDHDTFVSVSASNGFEFSLDVDGCSMVDSETFEDERQEDNVQSPNALIGRRSVFETQDHCIGFQPRIGEAREISSNDGCITFDNQDLSQDDGLLVVLTTPGDEELKECEANEDTKLLVQTEMDCILSTATVTVDSDSTGGRETNSGTDAVVRVERVVLPIATDSSIFELKSQSILNVLSEADEKNGGTSLKCASVSEQQLPEYNGTEHLENTLSSEAVIEEVALQYQTEKCSELENSKPGTTSARMKDSDVISTDDSSATGLRPEVASLVSASSVASDTQDSLSLLPETEYVEFLPRINEDVALELQNEIHFADSSPIVGSMLLENDTSASTRDETDIEPQANAMSLLSSSSEPFSANSLFQDSELFSEHLEGEPFAETSLLEELEQLATFSLLGRSKLFDEVGTGKEEIRGDIKIQPQPHTNVDPENDSKISIKSSEETSQEQPGYIYVFTDGCNSSKGQRFKVGSVICPYEELQRAKMFNVDIKLVSATAHSSPDRVFQQIKGRLEEWKMEGKEDWFLCPSTIILQTITEVVNTHF